MQSKQKQNKHNEDSLALIVQQWELFLQGKNAEQLVEIIQNYELDPLTSPIEQNEQLLQIYAWALLATGNYLQLKFLLSRYKKLLQFTSIAEAGAAENVKVLCKNYREYAKNLAHQQLLNRLNEATLKAVLTIFSKYYTKYKVSQIIDWSACKQQDFQKMGYKIEGGYVQLKKLQKTSQCLINKLKQLAIVANRMSKFE